MTDLSSVDWSKWTTQDLQGALADLEQLKQPTAILACAVIEKELKGRKEPRVATTGVKPHPPSHPDAPKLLGEAQALELMYRFTALEQQMKDSIAKVVGASGPPALKTDVLPAEPGAEIPTAPHPDALAKQEGPYNLWSGTKDTAPKYGGYGGKVENTGEYQAESAGGFIMGQTAHHFRAESVLTAAEGDAHNYEQDPSYHLEFSKWLEEPITDKDLSDAGLTSQRANFTVPSGSLKPRTSLSGHSAGKVWFEHELEKRKLLKPEAKKSWSDDPITDKDLSDAGLTAERAKFEFASDALMPRTFLLGDPTGKAWVEGELIKLKRKVGPEKDKSPALEVREGSGPPGKYDSRSHGTSEVENRSKLPTAPEDQVALIGLHDANFHSAWDPTSEDTAVDAVRSFTPVASFGVPGHRNPTATVQNTVEIPTIQREAANQKREIDELVSMLRKQFASDSDVTDGARLLETGVDLYFEGAMKLDINPNLSMNTWPPDRDRRDEDIERKKSVTLMTDGRKSIRDGMAKLKESDSYKTKKFR